MAPINGISVFLRTHSDSNSGTDDEMYLGLWGTGGGREFPLATADHDDFETDAQDTYVLGVDFGPSPTGVLRPDGSLPGHPNDPGLLDIELSTVQYAYLRKRH